LLSKEGVNYDLITHDELEKRVGSLSTLLPLPLLILYFLLDLRMLKVILGVNIVKNQVSSWERSGYAS
jgi:hypothetical protein